MELNCAKFFDVKDICISYGTQPDCIAQAVVSNQIHLRTIDPKIIIGVVAFWTNETPFVAFVAIYIKQRIPTLNTKDEFTSLSLR